MPQHREHTDLKWAGVGSKMWTVRKVGPGAARGTVPGARTAQWSPSQEGAWASALCPPPPPTPRRLLSLRLCGTLSARTMRCLGDLMTAWTAQHLLCARRFPYVVDFLPDGFVLFSPSCARGLEGPGCPTALIASSPGAEGLSSPCSAGHVVSRIAQEGPSAQTWKSVLQLRLPD